jgi:hypothetical protein
MTKWCDENVDRPLAMESILPDDLSCSAIPFSKEQAAKPQSFGARNKEWSIPGLPDVTKLVRAARRRTP